MANSHEHQVEKQCEPDHENLVSMIYASGEGSVFTARKYKIVAKLEARVKRHPRHPNIIEMVESFRSDNAS